MLRSIASVVAGYLVMAVIVVASMALLASAMGLTQTSTPPVSFMIASVALGAVAAVAGGWVCARLAPAPVSRHVNILVALVVVLGLLSAAGSLATSNPPPLAYNLALPVVGAAGAWFGGRLGMLSARTSANGSLPREGA